MIYPQINPVAFSLGPLSVHWYGLMYLIGFSAVWFLGRYRSRRPDSPVSKQAVGDVVFYAALGVLLGGRIGYVIFYDFSYFWTHPLQVFAVWDGGMSFHGGLLGVIIAELWYARTQHISFVALMDFFAPMTPIGLGAGRLGNFINGELFGRITDSRVGMIFPAGGPWPRYPSQLLEFFLEGVVLFIILWTASLKPRPRYFISALFLVCYGSFRCIAEFFREPDAQIGFIGGWLTEGQLLSIPMILVGIGLLIYSRRRLCKTISSY